MHRLLYSTHTRARRRTRSKRETYAHRHGQTHTHTRAHTHTHTHTHTHEHTHTHTHTSTHTHTHAHTSTHTHAHTHTPLRPRPRPRRAARVQHTRRRADFGKGFTFIGFVSFSFFPQTFDHTSFFILNLNLKKKNRFGLWRGTFGFAPRRGPKNPEYLTNTKVPFTRMFFDYVRSKSVIPGF